MLREHQIAVLNVDLPDLRLKRGDIGTVVWVYRNGEAYEVEFMTLTGETVDVVTLTRDQVRPVQKGEIACVRVIE